MGLAMSRYAFGVAYSLTVAFSQEGLDICTAVCEALPVLELLPGL
jgi:hypothetical protein